MTSGSYICAAFSVQGVRNPSNIIQSIRSRICPNISKSKLCFNPAGGPPPHPVKVIIPFSRPTKSSCTSTAKTTAYLPVKASKYAPDHAMMLHRQPVILHRHSQVQKSVILKPSSKDPKNSLPCLSHATFSPAGPRTATFLQAYHLTYAT